MISYHILANLPRLRAQFGQKQKKFTPALLDKICRMRLFAILQTGLQIRKIEFTGFLCTIWKELHKYPTYCAVLTAKSQSYSCFSHLPDSDKSQTSSNGQLRFVPAKIEYLVPVPTFLFVQERTFAGHSLRS